MSIERQGRAGLGAGFGERHPGWMLAAILLSVIVSTILLLSQAEGPVVLYQAF